MLNNICNVCGLTFQNFYPWGINGDLASFEICPCCGVQWGYEDCNKKAIEQYRSNWIHKGMNWFEPKVRPKNWDKYQQLKRVLTSDEINKLVFHSKL